MRKYDLVVLGGWDYDCKYDLDKNTWAVRPIWQDKPIGYEKEWFEKELEDLPTQLKEAVLYCLTIQHHRQPPYSLTIPLPGMFSVDIWEDYEYTIFIPTSDKYPKINYYPTIDEYKSLLNNMKGKNKWGNQEKRGRTRG